VASRTPFYPKRKLAIHGAYDRFERELFGPWSLFNSGKLITVTPCEGKSQQFNGGVEFSGTVRVIFWRFFDPDIRKVITDQIEQVVKECKELPDFQELALNETRELLKEFVETGYERMAEIDQRLRGKGYPKTVQLRSVGDKFGAMSDFIDEHIDAAKRLAALSKQKRGANNDPDTLPPKPPELLQELKWLSIYSRKHWLIVSLGLLLLIGIWIVS